MPEVQNVSTNTRPILKVPLLIKKIPRVLGNPQLDRRVHNIPSHVLS